MALPGVVPNSLGDPGEVAPFERWGADFAKPVDRNARVTAFQHSFIAIPRLKR